MAPRYLLVLTVLLTAGCVNHASALDCVLDERAVRTLPLRNLASALDTSQARMDIKCAEFFHLGKRYIVDVDGSLVRYYFETGPLSSSGLSWYRMSLMIDDEEFLARVRGAMCPRVEDWKYKPAEEGEDTIPGTDCSSYDIMNQTRETRGLCESGGFEKKFGNHVVFSWESSGGRCGTGVRPGNASQLHKYMTKGDFRVSS